MTNEEEGEGTELEDMGNSVHVCSSIEIEENLAIDESLVRSSKHRCVAQNI